MRNQAINKPEPLDPNVYHTTAERKRHDEQLAAWEASQRPVEPEIKAEIVIPAKPISEIFEDLYRDRWQKQQDTLREQEAAGKAKAEQRQQYLNSRPEVVDVVAQDAHTFLTTFAHFINAGYELENVLSYGINYSHVTLRKTGKKSK